VGLPKRQGGCKDAAGKTRKLVRVTKDDGFAVWTLGSPNTLTTYDKLNRRCVPQPFSMTGHPAYPVNHPWTTGMALSYTTEAILCGAFIEKHLRELVGASGRVTVGRW
jgi:hypothetical protein